MKLSEKARSVVAKKSAKSLQNTLALNKQCCRVYEDYVSIIHTTLSILQMKRLACWGICCPKWRAWSIGTIYILKAVLPDLATLSRVFQRGTINYILPAITYTTDNLTKIAQDETPITQLQVDVKESGRLSTCEFQSNKHKKQVLRNLLMNYTQVLKENIDSRFQDAMPVVYAFSIFNANALPNRGTAEFTTYGSKEIGTLSIHYFPGNKKDQQQVKAEREKLRLRANSSGTW